MQRKQVEEFEIKVLACDQGDRTAFQAATSRR